jgi:NADPH2:quinone reductase
VDAVVLRRFGPPEVLEFAEVPEPSAGEGEVVIDVEYANVTFVETQVRAGKPPHPSMLPALPAILGNGVAGTVTELGAGVEPGLTGRQVIASLTGVGGYAQRAVAAAQRLIELPEGVAVRDALALLADGRTALGLINEAHLSEGDTVLVEAAAGGVGTLLVQLARNAGAQVVAVAGGERKVGVARDLGAAVAIDYRDHDWAQQVRDAVGTVDVVFDGVGGDIGLAAFNLLGTDGRFCPFGMASGSFAPVTAELAQARRITLVSSGPRSAEELTALVRAILVEAAAGRIRPVIGQVLELGQAAAAHTAIEARASIGKTLLRVNG